MPDGSTFRANPRAATEAAMAMAEAAFRAGGRGDLAAEAVPFTNPARRHLVRRWHLYAWSTRDARQHTPWFRDLLRAAIAGCRAAERRRAA